jgi:Carboxypeptidase regulatory-like domain/TonB dependent receptor
MRHLRYGVALAALLAPLAIQAQETSSAIRGEVTNDAGAPIANATVVVTHTPSGTRITQSTGPEGTFNATGLRLGGPYSVEVTAPGYDSATETLNGLTAGTPQRITVFMVPAGTTINVTASRQRSAITLAAGPATVLDAADISVIANTSRDIRNLAVRSPFVNLDPTNGGAISIAGSNNRFNRFTVDGVQFGDPFGLEAGGLASARGPVPLDAISEFSIEIAPVDIQQGFFQGGAINAQLKSGGNELHGTGFFTYSSDALAGNTARGRTFVRNFESRNFGLQLTGPIVKDKLFFALTWERLRDQVPATIDVPPGLISQAAIDQVTQISNSVYNYDPLGVAQNVAEDDDKVVAKIDWNIADGHRAAFTYIYSNGTLLAGQLTGQATATNPTLALQSNNYNQGSVNHYGLVTFNDQWSDNFSTQLRVSYQDYVRLQVPFNGRTFGQFQVCNVATSDTVPLVCPAGVGRIQFGPDISRQANELASQTFGVEFQAQLKMNNHALKFIFERRGNDFNNLFAQRVSGAFYFDSIADLQAQRANQLDYASPIGGTIDSVRALFDSNTYTIGLQDTWDIADNLTFIYGFRWDLYEQNKTPQENPNFLARTGFPNTGTLNGRALFQPRFAVNWQPTDRLKLTASGGLFGGGNPNVWISNNYSNPGPTLGRVQVNRNANGTFTIQGVTVDAATANAIGAATLNGVTGGEGIPNTLDTLIRSTGSAAAPTNELDPNFKIPSVWRVSGTIDYAANLGPLGDDWNFGADVAWSRVRDAVTWTDLRSISNGFLPDGRSRYQAFNAAAGTNTDVLLTNVDRGYSWNVVARVNKKWDFGLDLGLSYTLQRAKDVNSGTSSVAFSNYTNAAAGIDSNDAAYGTSNYQIDNAYRINVGYEKAFFGDNKTRFQIFYYSRAGQRYSYTFADTTPNRSAVFGTTGTNNRYLIYVPNVASQSADPLVTYAPGFDFAGFQNFVQNSGLSKYQGQIAPKNLGRAPRFNKLDLHFGQELPLPFVPNGKFEVFADIENLLNLIDSDLGTLRQVAFPYYGTLANVACQTVTNGVATAVTTPAQRCDRYQYSNRSGSTFAEPVLSTFSPASFWQVRIGARVTF